MLLYYFEKGAEARGKPTILFVDPGNVPNPFDDKEVLNALDKRLIDNPELRIPEGFKKKVEKTPVYEYRVPDFVKNITKESKVIATEIMDKMLF